MKLWLLRPVDGLPDDEYNNPWEPWYDKAFGFVVRAEDEASARALADAEAGDENSKPHRGWISTEVRHPWLETKYSTCIPLEADGPAGVVMLDFHAA